MLQLSSSLDYFTVKSSSAVLHGMRNRTKLPEVMKMEFVFTLSKKCYICVSLLICSTILMTEDIT